MFRQSVRSEVDLQRAESSRRRASAALHLGALCLLATLEAQAAGAVDDATLLTIDLRENGWAVVCMNKGKIGPACSAGNENCFAFDALTERGRSLQSLITATMLAGRKASLYGTETCSTNIPDVEQLARFVMW